MPVSTWENLPDWERVLSSAARLQRILPEAVLVGGTASALYARHRFSRDADHVLADLRTRNVAPTWQEASSEVWRPRESKEDNQRVLFKVCR